jgi:hypothetical protein
VPRGTDKPRKGFSIFSICIIQIVAKSSEYIINDALL